MTIDEKLAETNSRIRRSGGILFIDTRTMMWMVTVVNAAPKPAYKHTEEFMRHHKMAMTRRGT